MGISGLLLTLKSVTSSKTILDYRGMLAGVDAMGWIHRSIHSNHSKSVVALAHYQLGATTTIDEKTKAFFINYVLKRCDLLSNNGVDLLMVIDGAPLISKRLTDQKRREDRRASYKKAVNFEQRGDLKEARKFVSRRNRGAKRSDFYYRCR